MEKNAGQMVAARVHAEKRHVGHVGDPGQGMPVVGMKCPEGPAYPLGTKPFLHGGVRRDVKIVVQNEEVETGRLKIGGGGGQEKKKGKENDPAALF